MKRRTSLTRSSSWLLPALLLAVGCNRHEPPGDLDTDDSSTTDGSDSSGDSGPLCGNLIVDIGEECDEGPLNVDIGTCTSTCTLNVCGDGLTLAGMEECDDGDDNGEGGACLPNCTLGTCGDGLLMIGVEECDEGVSNGDGQSPCRDDCALNVCGDGYLLPADEACDEGDSNGNGSSECRLDCALNVCGDGYLHASEACDEGAANGDGQSPCRADCELNVCGDGYQHLPTEDCEDGNVEPADGCSAYCHVPVAVVEVVSDTFHSCAILETNHLKCWGYGTHGELGFGDGGAAALLPAERGAVPLPTTVEQVALGIGHTCVIQTGGELRCFGLNDHGQLGLGDTNERGLEETAARVEPVPLGGPAIHVAAWGNSTCAIIEGGALRCWGRNVDSYLGLPGLGEDLGDNESITSQPPIDVGGPAQSVHMGVDHICALLDNGTLQCWGQAASGQTGHPGTWYVGDDETPAAAGPADVGGLVSSVAVGGSHTCVLLQDGTVRCFGSNLSGTLGLGHTNAIGDDELPSAVEPVPIGAEVVELSAGEGFTCARTIEDDLRCWGYAYLGRLGLPGLGNVGDDELASSAPNVDIGTKIIGVSSGGATSCVVTAAGDVRCWGWGTVSLGHGQNPPFGNLGDDEHPATAGDVPLF